jgi:hypothetical protein
MLTLGSIEEWLGRQRPIVIGKEGASAAKDKGEKTLADILNQGEEDSFAGSDIESVDDGWIDGVGEGRSDEANLSAYYRFSEGEDEDSPWRTDGITDLSTFGNKASLVGDSQSLSLQPTTSSVDEGDPGKVKALYDLVFEKSAGGVASGLVIAATRGGSLDIGLLHRPDRISRMKCTVEFWYWVPESEVVPADLVLVRRTMGPSGDDLSKVCIASNRESILWELILRSSGVLEFRTCAGANLLSSQRHDPDTATKDNVTSGEDSTEVSDRNDLTKFGRWNHVCLVLTSKPDSIAKCDVTIHMKGVEVASSELSVQPPGVNNLESGSALQDFMQKSHLIFGLNHGAGFRLTEIRIWACERSSDDTSALMYEYLTAAEAKKKFKVKISNKGKGNFNFGGAKLAGKGTSLAGPKSGGLAPTRSFLTPSKGILPQKAGSLAATSNAAAEGGLSLAPPPKNDGPHNFSLAPPVAALPEKESETNPDALPPTPIFGEATGFGQAFGSGFGEELIENPPRTANLAEIMVETHGISMKEDVHQAGDYDQEEEEEVPLTLWDTAIPLSQQVRSSAATALIRGPPATRHFGGNRGGLPDFSGMDRFGVGGVAICGSEKTIVWRDNEDPPALTYPIGASGAVVSDLMDDEGSEFLCCFLAKERRMVVFELQSRTVVVELQMTTKLNFWRFLPPEAAGNTLCFMLVTPVGGFHWMPLEEQPRPQQVWKRGPELQGKKVVSYEEGGSNGLDGPAIVSRVGLVMVTKATGGGTLEAWIVPIDGDSQAGQVSDDVMGACFCQPALVEDGPFLPLLVTAHQLDEGVYVNVISVTEPKIGSCQLGEIEVTRVIDDAGLEGVDFEPPAMAMGSFPEAICCSLGNIIVVIIRRKGLIAAFELEEDDLSLIALEGIGHYVIDAVMRYSAEVGGAEIVMLLADDKNPKDGRIVSFCFRSAV